MIRYCGRDFTPTEITQIRALIKNNSQFNRTRLSIEVCRILQWFKPDGKTKDMSCRVAMLKMEKDGVICLPPSTQKTKRERRIKLTSATDPQSRVVCPVHRLPELNLQMGAFPFSRLCRRHWIMRVCHLFQAVPTPCFIK